ncbi:MAG: hypothetical protein O2800_03630 [Planctomycetota bacterium]|nr:hypothetical protein [Planctomycetota bacterium]
MAGRIGIARSIRALCALARLAISTKLRLRGRYWTWRKETAFGKDQGVSLPAHERRRALIEYGDWVARMRALTKS